MFTGERGQPQPGERVWTAEDRDLALAWQELQAGIHGPCGQPLDRALGEGNDGAWTTQQTTCHACAARDKAVRALRENAEESGNWSALDGVVVLPVYDETLRREG